MVHQYGVEKETAIQILAPGQKPGTANPQYVSYNIWTQIATPQIRFMGLISPVGQSSIVSELLAAVSANFLQINLGWPGTVPQGTNGWEAIYGRCPGDS
jgi:hypothetical protein